PSSLFLLAPPPPPTSTLFPYTTLFRSGGEAIDIRGGRLTAVIVESPLPTLLQAIARQGGVEIFLHASLEETVSVTFRDVPLEEADRKSTRLNSSHQIISYAVFCLKKKK